MLEGKFTTKLLSALRKHPEMQGAAIWKLSDRWTSGIPDFVIVRNSRTTWWEVKVGKTPLTKLQSEHLDRLGWCAYVIRAHDANDIAIYRCNTLGFALRIEKSYSNFNAVVDSIVESTV